MTLDLKLPAGAACNVQGNNKVTMKGVKGEVSRSFPHQKITITVENNQVHLSAQNATKREKTIMNTFYSHIRNMTKGATEGHMYRLKICSGHFPMNVSAFGGEFAIKNFLGEKVPRKLKLRSSVTVKIEGQEVVVEGTSLEEVSQTAADIEQLTRIRNRDLRIFQDGIYITSKDGQAVGQA